MVKKFQRTKEDFDCEQCGAEVMGNGYTDHCPVCLFGKHVDIFPGDRLEECQGLMEPVAILQKKGKEFLEYQCQKCGYTIVNKVAAEDSREALLETAKRIVKKQTS
jgi:rubrerythrin